LSEGNTDDKNYWSKAKERSYVQKSRTV